MKKNIINKLMAGFVSAVIVVAGVAVPMTIGSHQHTEEIHSAVDDEIPMAENIINNGIDDDEVIVKETDVAVGIVAEAEVNSDNEQKATEVAVVNEQKVDVKVADNKQSTTVTNNTQSAAAANNTQKTNNTQSTTNTTVTNNTQNTQSAAVNNNTQSNQGTAQNNQNASQSSQGGAQTDQNTDKKNSTAVSIWDVNTDNYYANNNQNNSNNQSNNQSNNNSSQNNNSGQNNNNQNNNTKPTEPAVTEPAKPTEPVTSVEPVTPAEPAPVVPTEPDPVAPAEPIEEEPEAPKPIGVRVCNCGYTMEIYTYGLSDEEYDTWYAHEDVHLAKGEPTNFHDNAYR